MIFPEHCSLHAKQRVFGSLTSTHSTCTTWRHEGEQLLCVSPLLREKAENAENHSESLSNVEDLRIKGKRQP